VSICGLVRLRVNTATI